MSTELYVGPASSGKTAYALGLVREASRGLRRTPRLVVATHLQVRSCRRRLAELGGSIGAKVLTFDRVYSDCLASVGDTHTEISEPVRHRLIRAVLSELRLDHYAALSGRAGFVRAVADLIAELKSCLISPDGFAAGVKELGNEPRLLELALAYAAYEDQLRSRGWEDRAGLGWLALRVLKDGEAELWDDWSLVVVDGFAHLTPLQLAVLERLAARVDRLVMTLTGAAEGDGQRPLAYRRFERTRKELERRLGVDAHPLPESTGRATPLAELERQLFAGAASQIPASGGVDLIEAPDRDAEVRAALRWLKARVVQQGMGPGEVALLARDVAPYRPFIRQIADEFALPIRLVDGLPLRANPAVAALLSLIRLVLPRSEQEPEPALPWRQVVASWRSPYFDWSALPEEGAGEPIGVTPRDANLLDAAARWGRVVGGLSQWEEILADLAARPDLVGEEAAIEAADEERGVSAGVPVGSEAQELWAKFGRFLRRVRPPAGEHSYREYVAWLEGLIGPDPTLGSTRYPQPREPTALQVVAMARSGPEDAAERDVAALQLLKDIFRGMVLAEQALALPPIEFSLFFEELAAAVEAMRYSLPLRPEREEILVADVAQARGVPFRAAALLGMAEGEFPAALREDPFLRDSDRQQLRLLSGLPLDPSTLSVESELFYETVAGARCSLLLTRPRLADNGAAWQPSPFWESVRRLVQVAPATLTSESVARPVEAASWPELVRSLASCRDCQRVEDWMRQEAPARVAALHGAASVIRLRAGAAEESPYDGHLTALASEFAALFGPARPWSASRLESYATCPFLFFVSSVLGLEEREEPMEGLDARQLGNIYHRILERLYGTAADPSQPGQLIDALPEVGGQVLDEAPRREGFRVTAWWRQTRQAILESVIRSVEALAELEDGFIPLRCEAAFGIGSEPPLVVGDEGDSFAVRGIVDRIDRAPGGRLRIIDYKTSGPSTYSAAAVAKGKRLQLPLYALAAEKALKLGEAVEGFYWHVRQAEPSGLKLSRFSGGPQQAIALAVAHTWDYVRAAREGRFVPRAPEGGCPAWCPAAAFCWRFAERYGS